MQNRTIFKTPVISGFFRLLFIATTRLVGWRIVGTRPEHKKCVLIAAPHTSNWDFPTMMVAAFVLRLDIHWMGKDSLFPKGPLGAIMRWFGGISIDRSKTNNTVDQMVEQYRQRDELLVLITPEGTRSRVAQWKAGFYHIAVGAGVPIYLGFVDTTRREAGVGGIFHPTGNFEADIQEIYRFYNQKTGFKDRDRRYS